MSDSKLGITSFFGLLNGNDDNKGHNIIIPSYQREYAQGRLDSNATRIREGFVDALINSLNTKNDLELDFVFGGKPQGSENKQDFSPVDGQQRLTTLFLLHWYIFSKSKDEDGLKQLEKFSYATRTTTQNFCKKLVEWGKGNPGLQKNISDARQEEKKTQKEKKTKSYSDGPLANMIMDQSWFKGSMESDPTVQAMLVTLDCIHKKLQDVEVEDIRKMGESLKDNNCPVRFFCIDELDNVQGLYIKMNARGVPLTDFDIFKAQLQKKQPDNGRLDMLNKYITEHLEKADSPAERTKIIGRINNEYTNLFFRTVNDGKLSDDVGGQDDKAKDDKVPDFANAMMNFTNEFFRLKYFCAASEAGVGQKDYRKLNTPLRSRRGKAFSDFLEFEAQSLIKNEEGKVLDKFHGDKVSEVLVKAFENYLSILDILVYIREALPTQEKENADALFNNIKLWEYDVVPGENQDNLSNKNALLRMATFEFLLRFYEKGREKEEAFISNYLYWTGFIQRINDNTDLKDFDAVCENLNGYRKILASTAEAESDPKAIAKAIAIAEVKVTDENGEQTGEEIQLAASSYNAFREEKIKAVLRCASGEWNSLIDEAEGHLFAGQVWFLLELAAKEGCDLSAKGKNEYESGSYEFDRFKKSLAVIKTLVKKGDKKIDIDEKTTQLLERVLLTKSKEYGTTHLALMNNAAPKSKKFRGAKVAELLWREFYSGNDVEKKQHEIVLGLLKDMIVDEKLGEYSADTISAWLSQKISSFVIPDDMPDWQQIMIKLTDFSHAFEIGVCNSDTDKKEYTAVYSTPNRRTTSHELYSVALALRLNAYEGFNASYIAELSTFCDEPLYYDAGFPFRHLKVKETGGKERFLVGYDVKEKRFVIKKDGVIKPVDSGSTAWETIDNAKETVLSILNATKPGQDAKTEESIEQN